MIARGRGKWGAADQRAWSWQVGWMRCRDELCSIIPAVNYIWKFVSGFIYHTLSGLPTIKWNKIQNTWSHPFLFDSVDVATREFKIAYMALLRVSLYTSFQCADLQDKIHDPPNCIQDVHTVHPPRTPGRCFILISRLRLYVWAAESLGQPSQPGKPRSAPRLFSLNMIPAFAQAMGFSE